MGLDGLADLVMNMILMKLEGKDVARVACVNRRLKVCASEESLWAFHCTQDLSLSAPVDDNGALLPSFMVAYRVWRVAFAMYPWPLIKRVNKCWERLKKWLSVNFPDALATLRRGATEDELNDFEKSMEVKLPLPTRVIYRFCDGQEVPKAVPQLNGLIGGYSFYGYLANVYLLSLDYVMHQTDELRQQIDLPETSKFIVVASSPYVEKSFLLNSSNGQLYVGTSNLVVDGEMMPCVPTELLSSTAESGCSDQLEDALLLWLEEHARRLEDGIIRIREEGELKSINQYPDSSPLCSTAVTNGVQVRASAVFVPEMSNLQRFKELYLFSYSIRMRLLREGCVVHGMKENSCQLSERHWIIRENEFLVDDIRGEGVIGKNPLLLADEKEFVYESFSKQQSLPASIEGSFTFVPGRLTHPKGDPFEAEVARFPLELPRYIF